MAKNRGVSDAILKVRAEQPELQYKQIAAIVGCSEATVQTVCYRAGVGRRNGVPKKNWKARYTLLRAQHPTWTPNRIASYLGASRSTIYRIHDRLTPEACGVVALGRAAKRAGLTVKQIEEMANARHA